MPVTSSILTIRVPGEIKRKLESLAQATKRSKSFLALEAIRSYVALETWQVREIRKGLREAEAGDFADEAEVKRVFSKWHVNAD